MSAANPTLSSPLLTLLLRWPGEVMSYQEVDLGAIIRAFQGGDPLALDEVVRRLQGPLLRLAACVLRDPIAAEDAFIESMTHLLPTLRTFDNPDKFASFARKTVRNHCVDLLRRRTDRDARRALRDTRRAAFPWDQPGAFVEGLPGDGPSPEQDVMAAEELRLLRQAVHDLGDPGRTVLELVYRDGLSAAQVGQKLGLSHSKALRILGAARARLAILLRRRGVDDGA